MKARIISTGEIVILSRRIESSRYGVLYTVQDSSRSIPESDLQIFDDSGIVDFIEKWHPDYYHSDLIAWIDDLHCALDNECDDEKLARIKETWTNSPGFWLRELINLEIAAFRDSLERYYKLKYPNIKS